jgi:hypothetical protein
LEKDSPTEVARKRGVPAYVVLHDCHGAAQRRALPKCAVFPDGMN